MKRRTKVGFTLLEIACVIAIIVMLSVVFFVGVKPYMDSAKARADLVNDHAANQDKWAKIQSEVDAPLVNFSRPTLPSETTDNTPHPGPGPGGGGGGGNPGGGGGGGGETDPTVEPPSENTDAPGSNTALFTSNDWFGSQLKFDQPVEKFIVVTDGTNFDINCDGKYVKTYLGNGRYEIKYVAGSWGGSAQPLTEINFHIDNDFTKCYIESYEISL